MVDQVEQCGLGPLDVVDEDDQGPRRGQGFEEPAHGPEHLLRPGGRRGEPNELPNELGRTVRVGTVAHQPTQLGLGLVEGVLVPDASCLPDDLADGPERDAGAVGKTAPGQYRRFGFNRVEQLSDDARLADPGWSQDRDELAGQKGPGLPVGGLENGALPLPPDERRVEVSRRAEGAGDDMNESVGGNGLGLALCRDWADALDLDGVPNQVVGGRAHQDLAGRGGLLQTRRGVDRIAYD